MNKAEQKAYQTAIEQFVKSLYNRGDFQFALNITLKQAMMSENGHIVYLSKADAQSIGEKFITLLNREAYKHRYDREGKKLNTIISIERGSKNKRLHLHCAIGNLPQHCNSKHWLKLALKKIRTKKLADIYKENQIKQLYSDGFNGYISKDDAKNDFIGVTF